MMPEDKQAESVKAESALPNKPRMYLGLILPAILSYVSLQFYQSMFYSFTLPEYNMDGYYIRTIMFSIVAVLPFQFYLLLRYLQASDLLKARFPDKPSFSKKWIYLLSLISFVALPSNWEFYNSNSWSSETPFTQAFNALWLTAQMILPLGLWRCLRKNNKSEGSYLAEIFLFSAMAGELYLSSGNRTLSTFSVFWYLTQLVAISSLWNRVLPKKGHAAEASAFVDKLRSVAAGHDAVMEYHPFAAITRWRKQQEGALNKDLKVILSFLIPTLVVCFIVSIGVLMSVERDSRARRINAMLEKQKVENAIELQNYKGSLEQVFLGKLRSEPELKDYIIHVNIAAGGIISGVNLIHTGVGFKQSFKILDQKKMQREAELTRSIEEMQPLPTPPPAALGGNALATSVSFEPDNSYSGTKPLNSKVEFTGLEQLVSAGTLSSASIASIGSPQQQRKILDQQEAETDASRSFVFYAFMGTFVLCFGGMIFVQAQPTHIGLNKRGWRFLWRRRFNNGNGSIIGWEEFKRIYIERPENSTSPLDERLCFVTHGDVVHRIKMGSIEATEDRETLLKAIQKWAPAVPCDHSVMQALQPPPNHSYTELWLQALSAPPKRERLKPLADGTQLKKGNYIVEGQIGSGGQGHAYKAANAQGEPCVLKECILPVYVDVSVRRSSLEQFENEARLLRQIDHPQIVKLLDFFVEDHRTYLVLELIDGKSLRQMVKDSGAMSEDRVRSLSMQMCQILKSLHEMTPPVIHRDFTPDNLILNKDGTLKLIDFNVAKQVVESTTSGTVVGKHAYLPPEQFRGMPEPASDIYAMGATLHYLLCGVDPEPISCSRPKRVNPALSDSINKIVERATALDLQKRYKAIGELFDDLNLNSSLASADAGVTITTEEKEKEKLPT